jgi:hypothetical protein
MIFYTKPPVPFLMLVVGTNKQIFKLSSIVTQKIVNS